MSTNKPAQFNPVRGYHPEGAYWQGPSETQEAERFDFLAHLRRQRAFSERTFGPGIRTAGVLDHIRKELREIEAEPAKLSEWIDVVILALDGAWRAGYQPEVIIEALAAKQAKNEAREWPDWRTAPADKAIEHVRAATNSPVPAPAQEDPIRALIAKWRARRVWAKGLDVHDACADELEALLAPTGTSAPQAGDISKPCNCTAHIHCPRCKGADGIYPIGDDKMGCLDCSNEWPTGEAASPAQTPTSTSSAAARPPS